MTTRKQKELGLDTFNIELPKGYVKIIDQFLRVTAESENKTISEVFQELTEKTIVDSYGSKEAEQTLLFYTGQRKDFD